MKLGVFEFYETLITFEKITEVPKQCQNLILFPTVSGSFLGSFLTSNCNCPLKRLLDNAFFWLLNNFVLPAMKTSRTIQTLWMENVEFFFISDSSGTFLKCF